MNILSIFDWKFYLFAPCKNFCFKLQQVDEEHWQWHQFEQDEAWNTKCLWHKMRTKLEQLWNGIIPDLPQSEMDLNSKNASHCNPSCVLYYRERKEVSVCIDCLIFYCHFVSLYLLNIQYICSSIVWPNPIWFKIGIFDCKYCQWVGQLDTLKLQLDLSLWASNCYFSN